MQRWPVAIVRPGQAVLLGVGMFGAMRADIADIEELVAGSWRHPDLAGLPVHIGRMVVDLDAAPQ